MADTARAGPDESFSWVRCASCGAGLWRRYADRIEMTVSPRGREKLTISAPILGAFGLKVVCAKCSTVWIADHDLHVVTTDG